jgi:flavin reductase (DIM6/NTAB) family NADH-FMN oxidoreductase RutF
MWRDGAAETESALPSSYVTTPSDATDATNATHATDAFHAIMASGDPPSYVVTVADGDARAGCLVAFATQCSMDPPRFGVWLSKLNHTYRLARSSSTLVVHLLRDNDDDLARLFGGETGDEVDKFAGIEWSSGPDGCPVVERLDWFAGTVVERLDTGDHVGFVLAPSGGRCEHSARPLPKAKFSDVEAGHPVPDH